MSAARASCLALVVLLRIALVRRTVVALLRMCARQAQLPAISLDEAVVIDPFAARSTRDPLALVARHFSRPQFHGHLLLAEKVRVVHLAVRLHLLLVFILDLRIQLPRLLLRRLERDDADRLAGGEIDEGCCHLAPVAKLERTLAEPASGYHANRVRRTAVDFNEGHQPLAVAPARLFNAKPPATEHRHAHAQHLAGAQMPMRKLR